MKILVVSYHYWPPHFGGELKHSIERFQSLVERGHQVIVLTSGNPGMPEHEIIDGIEILRSPIVGKSRFSRGLRRLIYSIWVRKQMRKLDYDVLHYANLGQVGWLDGWISGKLTLGLNHKLGHKAVWVHSLSDTETEDFSNHGLTFKVRNQNLKLVDLVVSVSPRLNKAVQKVFPEKAQELVYGVRDDLFIPMSEEDKSNFRRQDGILEDDVVFSFLGSVGTRKGFDLLYKAFTEIENETPAVKLWVVGPKSKQENQNLDDLEINQMIEEAETSDKIRFWGRIDDRPQLAKILGASDVFVFPSRKEGFGIAPLEAMATGIPVIIAKIPGVTDLANVEGETGYYIDVNDAQALKAAMDKMSLSAESRSQMGEKARKRIVDSFGWQAHIDRWEATYRALINEEKR
ncbi:MAG: glycosyltransferase family 4 protein [Anaerolineaceae bacterium]|nr:glycosyltransferase family 4 protein [Anaerolineaceae bacterium]